MYTHLEPFYSQNEFDTFCIYLKPKTNFSQNSNITPISDLGFHTTLIQGFYKCLGFGNEQEVFPQILTEFSQKLTSFELQVLKEDKFGQENQHQVFLLEKEGLRKLHRDLMFRLILTGTFLDNRYFGVALDEHSMPQDNYNPHISYSGQNQTLPRNIEFEPYLYFSTKNRTTKKWNQEQKFQFKGS